MKVYIVESYENGIWGVYANKADAEEARKNAQYDAEMSGSHGIYRINEQDVH